MSNTLSKLWRLFSHHKGLGGDEAHPVADSMVSGFMSPEQFVEHNQIFSKRKSDLAKNTDILSLPPGFYEGNSFLNHPNQFEDGSATTWLSEINVLGEADKRRQFEVIDSTTGYRWYRTTNLSGTPESGTGAWVRQMGLVELWKGSSTLSNTPATLSGPIRAADGTSIYSALWIESRSEDGTFGLYYGPVSDQIILSPAPNLNEDISVIAPVIYEARLSFTTTTTATMESNMRVTFNTNKTDNIARMTKSPAKIAVTRICGVK